MALLNEYQDIFQLDGKKLGETSRIKFQIDTEDSMPLRKRQFSHPTKTHNEIKTHIDDLLKRGVIEPSVSPWASPCFLVPKKENGGRGKRFVIDYRGLNAITKKNSYPLPKIENVINRLRNSKFFSTLDLASGFYQIEMDPSPLRRQLSSVGKDCINSRFFLPDCAMPLQHFADS